MDIAFLIVLALILPAFQWFSFRKQIPLIAANSKLKEKEYKKTFIQLWLLFVVCFYLIHDLKWDFAQIGLSLNVDITWSIVFSLIIIFIIIVILTLKVDETNVEKIKTEYKDIMFFMPSTAYQYRWTIILSISAGITEEVIFRGFVFVYFEEFTGWIVAMLIANLIFALNHIWSGLKNLTGSLILGLIFSTSYLLTDTIIIPIILHILIDIYSMRTIKLLNEYLSKSNLRI